MNKESYIVSCINGVPPTEAVIDYGVWLAGQSNQTLKLLYSLNDREAQKMSDLSGSIGLGARSDLMDELIAIDHEQNKLANRKAKVVLEAAKKRVLDTSSQNVLGCLRHGRFVDTLLDLQDEISLLVIGRYGQKHFEEKDTSPLGHKVEAVIRAVEKPVLVVSSKFKVPQKIVLAFDGSKASQKALAFIANQPAFEGIEVHIVHAGTSTDKTKSDLQNAQILLQAKQRQSITQQLEGKAADVISTYAEKNQADMIVMGAFGHNWIHDFLMGSFTSQMLKQTNMPLLLVR